MCTLDNLRKVDTRQFAYSRHFYTEASCQTPGYSEAQTLRFIFVPHTTFPPKTRFALISKRVLTKCGVQFLFAGKPFAMLLPISVLHVAFVREVLDMSQV
eukprot:597634-Pleurochrysis_carterae.AAC.1